MEQSKNKATAIERPIPFSEHTTCCRWLTDHSSRQDAWLIFGGQDCRIQVISVLEQAVCAVGLGHSHPVSCLEVYERSLPTTVTFTKSQSKNKNKYKNDGPAYEYGVLSADADHILHWQWKCQEEEEKELQLLSRIACQSSPRSLALNMSLGKLLSGHANGTVLLWENLLGESRSLEAQAGDGDEPTSAVIITLPSAAYGVENVAFLSPNNDVLVKGLHGPLCRYSAAEGMEGMEGAVSSGEEWNLQWKCQLKGQTMNVEEKCQWGLSTCTGYVAVGDVDGEVLVLRTDTGKRLQRYRGYVSRGKSAIRSCAFGSSDLQVLAGNADGILNRFDFVAVEGADALASLSETDESALQQEKLAAMYSDFVDDAPKKKRKKRRKPRWSD